MRYDIYPNMKVPKIWTKAGWNDVRLKKFKRLNFKILSRAWRMFKRDCPVPNWNNTVLDDFDNAMMRLHNNYKEWWKKA